jgi:hypothetical protein
MEVVMIEQILTPGMQDGGDPNLRLQSPGAKLQERLAGGVKEQLEERPPVLPNHLVEHVGQGEHQMKIGNRQQGLLLLFEPFHRQSSLALGAMPVAATVRDKVLALASGALE